MKKFLAALVVALATTSASAWDLRTMNNHVDNTNFVLGGGCSATLISVTERLVLTNNHCITKYLKIKPEDVISDDGVVTSIRRYESSDVPLSQKKYDGTQTISETIWLAKILKRDAKRDLALLQIRQEQVPFTISAKLYDGPELLRGETIYVVGNPLGVYDASITKGIISSTTRQVKIGATTFDYVQVDAGVIGGNSGGALYNDDGLLVGVPAAALRGAETYGFAIPSTVVKEFIVGAGYKELYEEVSE